MSAQLPKNSDTDLNQRSPKIITDLEDEEDAESDDTVKLEDL
jgi:hypothetical protein